MPRHAPISLVLALALVAPAHAGNGDAHFLSNEASLTGGAVVANAAGGGAVWYNPAGLALRPRPRLDISGSAFVLRFRSVKDAVRVRLFDDPATPGDDLATGDDLSSAELISVPTALVVTRGIGGDGAYALGIFVPEQDTFFARIDSDIAYEKLLRYRQQVTVLEQRQRYHAGPAVGWALSERWRIGGALFAIYESTKSTSRLWFDFVQAAGAATDTRVTLVGTSERSVDRFGAQAVAGLQGDVGEGTHVGLVVRSPVFRVKETADSATLLSVAQVGAEPQLGFVEGDDDTAGVAQTAPLRVHAGLAVDLARGWVGLSADYQPALDAPERGIVREAVWNAQIGGKYHYSETLRLGWGAFTDRSASPEPTDIGQERVDYYGVAGGVQLRTPVALRDSDAPDALVFETSIGLRYALGVGEAGGLTFDFVSAQDATQVIQPTPSDVTFHEVAVTLGSALLF